MKEIQLEVVTSPGCTHCHAFEEYWKTIESNWANVKHVVHDVTTPEGQELVQKHMIFSSPGIILNGELFSMGGIDKQKFLDKLAELSH
jgi:glutaredoxin